MLCKSCGTENREGRRFCRECGSPLAAGCPACGAANEPDDKFCGECGTPLGGEPATRPVAVPGEPDRAEQRFVSVLFADMVGFTTVSEQRDSEEIRDLLTVYFERARSIIERFGGVVEKFIGDAVMGVWGARAVREDDAQRAVRAALELVDMVAGLGEEKGIGGLALRAGVNSGTTSVGPGGNEKGLVVGDLVNTASRLESLAEPGTVNVGPGTESVTNRAIDYDYLGEHRLKGKTEQVPVWRALRVAAMREGRSDDIRRPPFVGRERELRLLKDALAGVESDGRARLVSIIGEAGVGKSRLAEEFRNHIDGYTETIYWHWGRSPSYGDGVAFWALGEMVRRRAGILEGEDAGRSRTRLRTAIADFVPSEDDRQWIEPRLAALLGLAEMPSGTRTELFAALRAFFQHIAAKGPTVLMFEDMHWGDSGLLDFVGELVERSTRSPILVVTLARPDLLERHPTWGTQHRSSMAVRLGPLADDEMRSMLAQYLPGVGSDVLEHIAERAAGYPLYAVEIVRMLTGSGDLRAEGPEYRYEGDPESMALPETLQTVIGARLDRLDGDERSVLQDGAVLGLSFTLDALSTLRGEAVEHVRAALAPLVQFELLELEDDPRSPERGQYRFVQGLIHEVAYQRLNRSDRRAKHLAAAAYYAERQDPELAGIVAGHYMGAYEATSEGEGREEMVSRAIDALTDAADRAVELHSYRQAIDLLEEAIEIAPDEARRVEQRIKAAYAASLANEPERGLEHLAVARRHFEAEGDVDGIRRAATAESYTHNSHFRSDKALEAIRDVYETLDEIDGPVAVNLAAEAARTFSLTSHHAEAVAAADRLLPETAVLGEVEIALHTLISRATALAMMGRRVEAYAVLRGVAEEAENRGLLEAAGRALNNLGAVLGFRNPQEAARIAEHLGSVVARAQHQSWIVRHTVDTTASLLEAGEYDRALARLAAIPDEDLTPFWQHAFENQRAQIDLRRTGSREAFTRGMEALSFYDDASDPQLVATMAGLRASLCRDVGDWEECYRHAIAIDPELAGHGLWHTVTAAAWLRDPERLEAAAAALAASTDELPGMDDYIAGIRRALAGEPAAASAHFTAAIAEWKIRLFAADLAQAQATFTLLVGSDDPAAALAAEEAAAWVESTGSQGLAKVWEAALPESSSGRAAAG